MNCKEIILDGIIKKKPVFGTYLFRKFEKSQYEADEFFFDCEAVFNQLKQVVSNKYNKQKSEFYNLLTYGTDEGKEYAKSELAQFNPDNYPYNLVEISPKYAGYFLTNSDLRIIKNGIDEAQKKAENKTLLPHQTETNLNPEQKQPKTFEELFYNPEHAEPCLKILSELQPPVIDAINNYIGKAKGVFPLWVKVLKNHKPEPLIKHFSDIIYKDLLNQKVKGLNLTKDASEFRKQYVRLEKSKIELDIKTILSQYSQYGKLGK